MEERKEEEGGSRACYSMPLVARGKVGSGKNSSNRKEYLRSHRCEKHEERGTEEGGSQYAKRHVRWIKSDGRRIVGRSVQKAIFRAKRKVIEETKSSKRAYSVAVKLRKPPNVITQGGLRGCNAAA